jgi:hypothetical protein
VTQGFRVPWLGPEAVEDMRSTLLLCSSSLLLLGGCSVGTWIVGESQPDAISTTAPFYDYSVYFRAFDNPWVGRSRDELIEALGPPDAIYEARHQFADYDAGIPAATYIYTNGIERSGDCIDAYVVDEPTATVIKYYCR